jgi:hypothetical protein
VRKLSAAFLVILFSLALLTPLLASAPEDNLPICCRRDGKHACAMRKAAAPEPGPGFSARPTLCSHYPLSQAIPVQPLALAAAPSPRPVATAPAPLTPSAQTPPATDAFTPTSPRAPPAAL